MSIMRCDRCDRYIDTDYDVEGEFRDTGFICALCIENEGTDDINEANRHREQGDEFRRTAETSHRPDYWLNRASMAYALASVITLSMKEEGDAAS